MKPPLISCIVPVFNGERYLGEALDSILAQSYQPLEIIVVDDGSTDSTASVANRYQQRIRYLWQTNAGEAAARDHGLKVAQGELIAFLDADDLWHSDKLTRQMTLLREQPEVDISFTHFNNFWIPDLAGEEKRHVEEQLSRVQTGWSISTFLASRSVFDKFDTFSETRSLAPMSEAMIWYLRAARRGAIIHILPEVLMFRRLHLSNQSRRGAAEALLSIVKEWRDHQRHKNR